MNPYASPTAEIRRPWDGWREAANLNGLATAFFAVMAAICAFIGFPLLFGVIIGEPDTFADAVATGVCQLVAIPGSVILLLGPIRIGFCATIAYWKCYKRRITYTIPSDRRVQRLLAI